MIRSVFRPSSVVLAALLALGGLAASLPPSPADARPAAARSSEDSFTVATFNILGSQHTKGPGGWGPGPKRARLTARIIAERDLDLVGMQEVQADQLAVLQKKLTGYGIWPGTSLGGGGVRLQIAYDTSRFELLKTGSMMTPFDRQIRPIPYVLLRNIVSQRKLYVIDVHNSPRGQEKERDAATAQEIALVNQLRATRKSVLVLGDMNEKEEWFCKVVGGTDLDAANGGTAASETDCQPPAGYLPIDWIMGRGAFTFSDYAYDDDAQVRTASDHRLVHARVTLKARPGVG